MKLKKLRLIGRGGVWKVFRLGDQKHVFRVPFGSTEYSIQRFIENHKIVKELGLPTLAKVERLEFNNEIGIRCEDLNISGLKVYVTYNSLYSDSDRKKDKEMEALGGPKRGKRTFSKAEQRRHRYKLTELTGFERFLKDVKTTLDSVTLKNVGIDFDSYFFGTINDASQSPIDYIIADLDHILSYPDAAYDEILENNYSEFNRAMTGFLKNFVKPAHRREYLDALNLHIPA